MRLFSLSELNGALVDLNIGAEFLTLVQIGCLNIGVAISSFRDGTILVGKFLKFELTIFIVVLIFTYSMELSILYFKGSQVEISKL